MTLTPRQLARFWSRVRKQPDGCWVWTGAMGQFNVAPFCVSPGVTKAATRIAWELTGRELPQRMKLTRTCENPRCIAPHHREPGLVKQGPKRQAPVMERRWSTESMRELRRSDDRRVRHLRMLPKTMADCPTARPCPHVSCKHHLAVDVKENGAIQWAHGPEQWELPETCAMDVANRGGATLEEVGTMLGLTRERVRQVEAVALRKLRARLREVGVEGAGTV